MDKTAKPNLITATVVWFFYASSVVMLAITLCWALYSQSDYGYRFWYQYLDIGAHIQLYGPQNRFKAGLEQLPPEQHWQAFKQIRDAVHNGGEGLAEILYQPPGKSPRRLLRYAEVQHLQDVANFIDAGRLIFWLIFALWLPLAWLSIGLQSPPMRWRLGITVFTLGGVLAWLAIVGPTQVFYQFHLWIFPADHQWFFYWQDSLMSTLMKAPMLFGGIAVVIALGATLLTPILYWLGLWGVRFMVKRTAHNRNIIDK